MGLGIPEIIIIILAIAVVLFGGKKITELARSMGSASGEFKKARREVERELKEEEAKAEQSTEGSEAARTTEANADGAASTPKQGTTDQNTKV